MNKIAYQDEYAGTEQVETPMQTSVKFLQNEVVRNEELVGKLSRWVSSVAPFPVDDVEKEMSLPMHAGLTGEIHRVANQLSERNQLLQKLVDHLIQQI